MRFKFPSRIRDESGQSLIETSLTLVIIFTVVFWVFEICSLMYTYVVISDAAHEGVRYAVVRSGIVVNDAGVTTKVTDFAKLSMHNVSAISVTTELPDGTNVAPNRVRVRVTYSYIPFL